MLKVGSFSISRFLEDVSVELFEGTTEGKEPREKTDGIIEEWGDKIELL